MKRLVRIVLPYAVFGIEVDEASGRVTEAAPIGKWMVGKQLYEVAVWVWGKGGQVEIGATVMKGHRGGLELSSGFRHPS